jgi:hypothetical protein
MSELVLRGAAAVYQIAQQLQRGLTQLLTRSSNSSEIALVHGIIITATATQTLLSLLVSLQRLDVVDASKQTHDHSYYVGLHTQTRPEAHYQVV